ncbi:hypothetical protein ACFXD5_37185 [Streptomyces sp. NPDC059385]|uniref:hypothetical protein n=1 Tax=Streptomyces sp. NPDC059385 TaxID=3346817 RepID=UPI0036C5DC2B
MIDTAEQLLAAVAPLPHPARLRLTAVTARRLADCDELRSLLVDLEARGPYGRRLAALAALVGGDVPHLAARLADPDPVVRRYALRGARRLPVPDRAVETAYDDAPAVVRSDLARLLCEGGEGGEGGGRSALAERLVPRLRADYGDRDAARLLPGCSPEFAARMLPELAAAVPFEGWGRLGLRHPLALLDHAERELATLRGWHRDTWWTRHATGIGAALPAAPERVLELLERHGPSRLPGPVYDRLGDLVAADAERITRWLAAPQRSTARWEPTPSRRVLRQLVDADPPSLPRYAARWFNRQAFTTLLDLVPPSRRQAFTTAVAEHVTYGGRTVLRDRVLAVLPVPQRYAEATARIEELRAEGGSDWDIWLTTALLPPEQARPQMLAALTGADADEREMLWTALIQNAGRSGDSGVVAEAMTLAAARVANDRDPVRWSVLEDFGNLPGGLLAAAVAGAGPTPGPLERLCRDALGARDCSDTTRWMVGGLALKLLGQADGADGAHGADGAAAAAAVRIIEALTAHTGTLDLGVPHRNLPAGRDGAVLEGLLPWLDRAAARGDAGPLIEVGQAFGRRAQRLPVLQDRLARALRACSDTDFSRTAALWLGSSPSERDGRVAELLDREPSAVFTAPVLAVLAARRTDLLDRALVATPPPGRFPTQGAPRELPDLRYADRWTPRQQEAAVGLVRAALADDFRSLDERAKLLRAVASVPEHGPALVREYLPSEKPEGEAVPPVFARAALEASGHGTVPDDALTTLLDHAGTDGAATAWAAAGRVADRVRPSLLAALLRDLLTRESGVKVTVRKSAARLAALHLPPEAAAELLAAVARDPRSHPDVQIAVAGLAVPLLPAPGAVELVERVVAHGPSGAQKAFLERTPLGVPAPHRSRYGTLVARLAVAPNSEVAAEAVSALAVWARYAPEAAGILGDLCTDPSAHWDIVRRAHGSLRSIALSDLPHPVGGAEPGSVLHGVVTHLVEIVTSGEEESRDAHGRPGPDLPARRCLEALTQHVYGGSGLSGPLARHLAGVPALTPIRAALLAESVDLTAPGSAQDLAEALREIARTVEGRPVLAGQTARYLHERHRYGDPLETPGPVFEAVAALGYGLAEGLLAVALAHALGMRQGWTQPCREAVLALRDHPEQEVRDAAYAVVMGQG